MTIDSPPPRRWRRLAAALRDLRLEAGLSGQRLAKLTGKSQPWVSRVETAKQPPSVEEVEAWGRAVGASRERLAELVELADATLTETRKLRADLRKGFSYMQQEVRTREATAGTIRIFHPSHLPGIVHTAPYTRKIFEFTDIAGDQDYDAAVAGRLARQQALYDGSIAYHFVVPEAALWWRPGPPELLLAQLDRLLTVMELPSVSLGIIPLNAQAQTVYSFGFVIFDDRGDEPPIVAVDTWIEEREYSDPWEVQAFQQKYERLERSAVFDDDARGLVARAVTEVRQLDH